jgi:heme/copper-type cytochrome/quinol oxidase subunit 2
MSEYEIEKDIPIPAMSAPRGRKEKYPWSTLDVGHSFFVPDVSAKRMQSTASKAAARTGRTFVARNVEGGVRVWRYE